MFPPTTTMTTTIIIIMNNDNIINYEFRLVVAATVDATASEQNDRGGGRDGTYDDGLHNEYDGGALVFVNNKHATAANGSSSSRHTRYIIIIIIIILVCIINYLACSIHQHTCKGLVMD